MENKLEIIVRDSGLEETKASVLLKNFSDYFKIADEWEKKAKKIVIKDESQKSEMSMARIGRLFLREKRIAIEKSRKALKEQSLREGKAIDGISNVLKSLIIPIEDYLYEQENFVSIKADKEAKILEDDRVEKERIAEEKRLKEEKEKQAKLEKENNKLKKEKGNLEKKRLIDL